MIGNKAKFPRRVAVDAVREMLPFLVPECSQIIVAGSLRRKKVEVGDIEILYVSNRGLAKMPGELIPQMQDLADTALANMEARGLIKKRENVIGAEMCGPKNKYFTHVASGIPVDFFAATAENWHNYLVCRTGPLRSNISIATRASEQGYQWKPYECGFLRLKDGEMIPMASERAVFEFVGLEYREPKDRE